MGGNPTPGLLSLWPSSNGSERAGRGKQGLAAAVLGLSSAEAEEGREEEGSIPLPDPVFLLWMFHGCPGMRPGSGSGSCPCPAHPPCFPSPHTSFPQNSAHGAAAAAATPRDRRGPTRAPLGARSLHVPLPLRPG